MTAEVTAIPGKSAKRIGWGLVALALVTPSLMSATGFISAFKSGELTVQVGFAWLVAAVVIDLILKKRDATTKANGRIVAATLALVMALATGVSFYRDTQKVDAAKKELIEQFMKSAVEAKTVDAQAAPAYDLTPVAPAAEPQIPSSPTTLGRTEADRVVVLMGLMKERAKRFAEEFGALDRKFNSIDLGTILVPQSLISNASIQASRKKLDRYKALITERDALLKQHFVLSEQIIRGAGLTEQEIQEALSGLNSNKGTVIQNYANLTIAQLATVKASQDILSFAEHGLGRISVQDGQLMFQTQPELDEYQRLMQVLTDAASKESAITEKVTAQAQKSKQSLVDQLK